ncbi:MAG: hypothetical protein Q8Q09_12800 [Deltaproteobacteria bacterium]|nr:hypothetical protein [Deltaproteobacteria bacterium]
MTTVRHVLTASATLSVLAALTFAAAMPACGNTGFERVHFRASVGGVAHEGETLTFETRAGWTVTLERARLAIGPIYFNTIVPLQSHATGDLHRGWRSWFVPIASANGESHIGQGRIVGEITEQLEVDVLSPTLQTFSRDGIGLSEPVASVELWLYNRASLDNAVATVAGTARRGELVVPFVGQFAMDPADATTEQPLDSLRRIRGIAAPMTLSEGASVTLRVDLRPAFANADFSELTAHTRDREGRYRFARGDNVFASFQAGLRSTQGTWNVSFTAPSTTTR